jgi:hypothetical protein
MFLALSNKIVTIDPSLLIIELLLPLLLLMLWLKEDSQTMFEMVLF